MRKIISAILTTTMVFSSMAFTAFASEDAPVDESHIMLISLDDESDIMPISLDESINAGDQLTYNGTVKEVGEGYIMLDEENIQFNIDDATFVANYDFTPYSDIKAGDIVTVVASEAKTKSIPAQSYASYVLVNTDNSQLAPIYVEVASNDGSEILSADGKNRVIISDETQTRHHSAKIRLMAKDITVGSKMFVFASVVGMSIPAYVPAQQIVVMDLADEAFVENDVVAAETIDARTTVTYNGTVEEAGEGYITLADTDLQFNYDENTFVANYDFVKGTVKAGDIVTVVADTVQTKSIPAQSYAYYILVNDNDSQAAPIYVEVASNDGSEILSADGEYRIAFTDETQTKHHSAKIRLMAKDITAGSKMFAFSQTVGLSLPAYVAAEKIVVVDLADETANDIEMIVVDDMVFEVGFNYVENEAFGENSTARFALRNVCEALGYDVSWNADTQSIELTKGEQKITMETTVAMARNGQNPIIIDGTTYVTNSLFNVLYGEDADVKVEDNTITITTVAEIG